VIPFFRRPAFIGSAALAMAAAAAVGFYIKGRAQGPNETAVADAPWSGKVAGVSRASADKTGGFEACDAQGACSQVAADTAITQGTTLRTDARTRARVSLADGTWMALDRDTEVALAAGKDRAAKLVRGSIVADVATITQGPPAKFAFDSGSVEVLGTKLQITAGKDRASVEVARGAVRVAGSSGKWIDVRAGEEATILGSAEPVVASSTSLADVMEWSDQSQEEVDAPVLRGLGELRAKKPGDTKEKDRAVRLSKHSVKVRVVDLVARTEVDETFTNETDDELEGIFRFPLPPGAQIENLSLEVDGQLITGAFVDRDKGAAIWRGVIQNAAPKQAKPREEIIWVPGPWRDPALLEWQRGGRFELRIFPIPKRGSRRVVLAYTQTVDQSAGVRRFTYPLAHDTSGTTKIDSFDLDVQVLGHDKSLGVTTRGYEMVSASGEGEADRRTLHATSFTPSGDLTVEYALPDRDKEVTAWAYRMDTFAAPAATGTTSGAPAQAAPVKAATPDEKAAIEAARTIANDASPYVAIAVRPKLPRWQEQKERTHVIVVDTSRSMIGERFARARRLTSTIVKEMDRRDSFMVLACDTTCRGMDGTVAPRPSAPGASAAADVEKFLSGIEPDGGSDIAASITAARAAAGSARDREVRILYLGDGTPTVGPTRAAHLETAVRSAMPPGDGSIVAVALGADADMTSLQALARGGGGVVVPYVPGQKVSTAALEVLSAAYGVVLRDPEIELPQGLTQITPSRLDPIRAGGESIIVARMAVDGEVSGQIKLRGRVSGERFEQVYPVKVVPTSSGGNAFVPRMFAAAKIAELERTGGDLAKPMIVELSKRFAVASQFTSLLVLESAAMFKAFGLDRGSVGPTFTGEERARSESADAEGEPPADEAEELGAASSSGDKKKESKVALDDAFDAPMNRGPGGGGVAAPSPAATMAPPAKAAPASKPSRATVSCAPGDPFCFEDLQQPTRRPPSRPSDDPDEAHLRAPRRLRRREHRRAGEPHEARRRRDRAPGAARQPRQDHGALRALRDDGPPRRGAGAHRALERPRRARPRRAPRPRRSGRAPGRSRARHPHPRRPRRRAPRRQGGADAPRRPLRGGPQPGARLRSPPRARRPRDDGREGRRRGRDLRPRARHGRPRRHAPPRRGRQDPHGPRQARHDEHRRAARDHRARRRAGHRRVDGRRRPRHRDHRRPGQAHELARRHEPQGHRDRAQRDEHAHRVPRPPRARLRRLRHRGLARRRSGRDHGRGRQRRRPRRPHHPPPRRGLAQGAFHADRRPRRGWHTPRLLRVAARAGGRVRSRGLERPLTRPRTLLPGIRPTFPRRPAPPGAGIRAKSSAPPHGLLPPAAVPPTADGTGR
jgi:ferric-dicitrate binding protein FerR (iron transport regulator)